MTKKQLSFEGHLMCTLEGRQDEQCFIPDGKCSECHFDSDAKHVEKVYNDFWKPIIEKDGKIDVAQLKKELHDFHILIENVPLVYCHITNDRMSKPNYLASEVIAVADDCVADAIAREMKDFKDAIKEMIDDY